MVQIEVRRKGADVRCIVINIKNGREQGILVATLTATIVS